MSAVALAEEVVAYLLEEADFNRSWTDGRNGGTDPSPEYVARRLELAAQREAWAEAVRSLASALRERDEWKKGVEAANRIAQEHDRAASAARERADRAEKALGDAASSLEWIGNGRAEPGEATIDALFEVRAFARSRAGVARRALADRGGGAP